MGIVKCNGYGLGLIEYSKLLLEYGIDLLGVSCFDEAIALRDSGIECEIVLLTPYCEEDILKALIERNIILEKNLVNKDIYVKTELRFIAWLIISPGQLSKNFLFCCR